MYNHFLNVSHSFAFFRGNSNYNDLHICCGKNRFALSQTVSWAISIGEVWSKSPLINVLKDFYENLPKRSKISETFFIHQILYSSICAFLSITMICTFALSRPLAGPSASGNFGARVRR